MTNNDFRRASIDAARVLFKLSGAPNDDETWRKFCEAAEEALREVRRSALSDAHIAARSYRPIDPDGMKPSYRKAYDATVEGCAGAVLALYVEAAAPR